MDNELNELISKVPPRTSKTFLKCGLTRGVLNVRLKVLLKFIQEFKNKNWNSIFHCITVLTYTIEDSYTNSDQPTALPNVEYIRSTLEKIRYLVLSEEEDILYAEKQIKQILKTI